jgi:hypothetical protein
MCAQSTAVVAVVGAGAAGLTAAIRAAQSGARVVLLNAHREIGLKILMSGGTRCNVTHRVVTERDYSGGSQRVVARILRAFSAAETIAWFERDLGVALKVEDTGKVFPASDDARTVLAALLEAGKRAGVEVRRGARVIRIEDGGGGPGQGHGQGEGAARFELGIQRMRTSGDFGGRVAEPGRTAWPLPASEPEERLPASAIVLATGGLSFPRTGSDGTGYALAQSLGHTLVPPVPALTPLASADPLCAALQGLAVEAREHVPEGRRLRPEAAHEAEHPELLGEARVGLLHVARESALRAGVQERLPVEYGKALAEAPGGHHRSPVPLPKTGLPTGTARGSSSVRSRTRRSGTGVGRKLSRSTVATTM